MTKKSPVGAYQSFGKSKWLFSWRLDQCHYPDPDSFPYYSVIGGWVIKYLIGYFSGQAQTLASDTLFFRFYLQWSFHRDLLYCFYLLHLRHHLRRCAEWY